MGATEERGRDSGMGLLNDHRRTEQGFQEEFAE